MPRATDADPEQRQTGRREVRGEQIPAKTRVAFWRNQAYGTKDPAGSLPQISKSDPSYSKAGLVVQTQYEEKQTCSKIAVQDLQGLRG